MEWGEAMTWAPSLRFKLAGNNCNLTTNGLKLSQITNLTADFEPLKSFRFTVGFKLLQFTQSLMFGRNCRIN